MAISYRPFIIWFNTEHPTKKKKDIQVLSAPTISKIFADKPEQVSQQTLETIDKLCTAYNLRVDQVIEYIPDEKLKKHQ